MIVVADLTLEAGHECSTWLVWRDGEANAHIVPMWGQFPRDNRNDRVPVQIYIFGI